MKSNTIQLALENKDVSYNATYIEEIEAFIGNEFVDLINLLNNDGHTTDMCCSRILWT